VIVLLASKTQVKASTEGKVRQKMVSSTYQGWLANVTPSTLVEKNSRFIPEDVADYQTPVNGIDTEAPLTPMVG
jgi:hypothetical protein